MNFLEYVHLINTEITHACQVELNAWDDDREAAAEKTRTAKLHTALGYQIDVLGRGKGASSTAILNADIAIVQTGEIPIEGSARLVKSVAALNDRPLSARVAYMADTGMLSLLQNVDIGMLTPQTLADDFAAFVRAITVTRVSLEKFVADFEASGFPVAFPLPDNFSAAIAARAAAHGVVPREEWKSTARYDHFLQQLPSRWGVQGVSALGVRRINETFASYRTADNVDLTIQFIVLPNSVEAVAVTVQIAQLHQKRDATVEMVAELTRFNRHIPGDSTLYADVRPYAGTEEVTDVSVSRIILLNVIQGGRTHATAVQQLRIAAAVLSDTLELDGLARHPGTTMYLASQRPVVTPGGYVLPACVVRKGERALQAFEQAVFLLDAPENDDQFVAFAEMLALSFAPPSASSRGRPVQAPELDLTRIDRSEESISFSAFDKTEIRLTRLPGKEDRICVYASACQISCGGALPNGAPSFWQGLSTVTAPVDVIADNGGNVIMMRTLLLAGKSDKQMAEDAAGFWKQVQYVRHYFDQLDIHAGKTRGLGKTTAFSVTVHNRGYHAMPSHIIDRVYRDREKRRASLISTATLAVRDSAATEKAPPREVGRLSA